MNFFFAYRSSPLVDVPEVNSRIALRTIGKSGSGGNGNSLGGPPGLDSTPQQPPNSPDNLQEDSKEAMTKGGEEAEHKSDASGDKTAVVTDKEAGNNSRAISERSLDDEEEKVVIANGVTTTAVVIIETPPLFSNDATFHTSSEQKCVSILLRPTVEEIAS